MAHHSWIKMGHLVLRNSKILASFREYLREDSESKMVNRVRQRLLSVHSTYLYYSVDIRSIIIYTYYGIHNTFIHRDKGHNLNTQYV